jgi:hypothetical protein
VELPLDGGGGLLLSSGHLEYNRKFSHTVAISAHLHYVRSQMNVIPLVKAELELGQSVTMAGANEKVGVNQYHRYHIDVPEGVSSLTVTLDGLSADANLYVQREGAAHYRLHGWSSTLVGADQIVIETPVPGVYEISVHGTHDIANGVAYTLSVDAEVGPVIPADPSVWQNPVNRFDVNDDQVVTPLDLSILLDDYRVNGPRELPVEKAHDEFFIDINGDKTFDRLDLIELFDELFSLPI